MGYKNALMRYSRLVMMLATASGLILGSALFGQFVLDWYPCELCMYQRYPYMAIIILAAIGLFFRGKVKVQQALAILSILLLFVTGGIATFHTGVEMKIFTGPSACSASSSTGLTIEEMRAQLLNAPLVSCDQAMAYVFGLSLAAWNMILAFGLAVLAIFMFFAIRKRGLR